ncbi:MAG: metallophosphoesterase [Opitutales bacterium]
MAGRTVIIGDVHGCIAELEQLLGKLRVDEQDDLLFLGDLVNKGPDSAAVVRLARERRARCVRGNHEVRLLRYRRTGAASALKGKDLATVKQLTAADWAYLETMPLLIELPEFSAVAVHGGFAPRAQHWRRQPEEIVTQVQVIDSNGEPRKRSEAPRGRPWADFWEGPEFVLYGHTPRREVYRRTGSIGLDTGCVYGGALTAFCFPHRTLHQVPAERVHEYSAEF